MNVLAPVDPGPLPGCVVDNHHVRVPINSVRLVVGDLQVIEFMPEREHSDQFTTTCISLGPVCVSLSLAGGIETAKLTRRIDGVFPEIARDTAWKLVMWLTMPARPRQPA